MRGRTAAAEAVGTALLLAIVVGSGIMGERLAQGNLAVALLANSIATGAGLYVLIVIFGPISGAHFNPVVSAVAVYDKRMSGRRRRRLRNRAMQWSFRRRSGSTCDVWTADCAGLRAHPADARRGFRRSHRDFRASSGDFARIQISAGGGSSSCRRLYYQRLLVYFLHLLRQSRRHFRARYDGYLRRNLTAERPFVCRGANGRWLLGRGLRAVAYRQPCSSSE